MQADLQGVMRLQAVDLRAAELTREIATLPKHIAEIEKKLSGGQRRLEADKAALSANQRDRKKIEGDIQANHGKISKLRDQMLTAKTNEQYRAFQHEIEFCENEIKKSEERILELMTQSEPLDRNVKTAETSLKQENAEVEAEKKVVHEKTALDQAAVKELLEERKNIVAGLSAGLVSQYERIRKTRQGIAIAEAIDGRCSRCFIVIRPQFLQELKRGDKVMTCESCSRILFYVKPESFEDQIGARA